jgi:hypothetical protein
MRTEHLAPEAVGALSARQFADRLGLSEALVVKYCRRGRIFGARKHPLTRKWWIFPPAKLLFP